VAGAPRTKRLRPFAPPLRPPYESWRYRELSNGMVVAHICVATADVRATTLDKLGSMG